MDAAIALAAVQATQIPLSLLAAVQFFWPIEPIVKNNTCFEYVIIGGGTAGMVLARRLTEDTNINVLVLEAGGDPPVEALLAGLFVTLPLSQHDWNFTSTYDSYAANSQPGNVTKITAGRMLGGSSCMNHFIHGHGAPEDFNSWADLVQDPSWRYENILPYFKKSEILKDPVVENSPSGEYHGFNGPMGVARQPSLAANPYLVSFGEIGNRVVLDLNGPEYLGYTQSMLTLTDGFRQCSAYSYIRPVRNRTNLFVLRNTYATKIIFNKHKKAVAVKASKNSMIFVFKASKEIIVSTGVYKTPQLLMLSGIGDREYLKSFNIKPISDLPVGDNLREQTAVAIVHRTDQSPVDPILPLPTLVPFPVINGLVTVDKTKQYGQYQVFALLFGKATPNLILACAVVFGYRPEICDSFVNQVITFNSLFSLITLLQPDSSGKVRLNNTNPFSDPVITTGIYDKDSDLDQMVAYVKDYMRVSNTTFFTQVNASFVNPGIKSCVNFTIGSNGFWRCYIQHMTVNVFHPTSSCPMGTVVDSHLRVYGVTNLRIVDASVMPTVPRSPPNAAVIMIAEKASVMIKEDADRFPSCVDLKKCGCNIRLPNRGNSTVEKEKSKLIEL